MKKDFGIKGVMAQDAALIKSFTPKATPIAAATPILSVKGSQQPKATPIETKGVAPPPSKDD